MCHDEFLTFPDLIKARLYFPVYTSLAFVLTCIDVLNESLQYFEIYPSCNFIYLLYLRSVSRCIKWKALLYDGKICRIIARNLQLLRRQKVTKQKKFQIINGFASRTDCVILKRRFYASAISL